VSVSVPDSDTLTDTVPLKVDTPEGKNVRAGGYDKRGDMSAQPFLEAIIPDSNLRRGVAIEYLKADRATAYGEGVQKLALEQAASTAREQDDGFGHD
jgi:hypothetical protein